MHDRLLEPALAKECKVNARRHRDRSRAAPSEETLNVGVDMEAARPKLKTLDTDFQKTLLKVSRARASPT